MILASSCRKVTWPHHCQTLEALFQLCLSALLLFLSSLTNAMQPREASTTDVSKRVAKSFLLGRALDPVASMTDNAATVVAFALQNISVC